MGINQQFKRLVPETYEVDESDLASTQLLSELGIVSEKQIKLSRVKRREKAQEVSKTPEEERKGLEGHEELSARLGITNTEQIRSLPTGWKFMQITVNKSDESAAAILFSDLALSCDDSFVGGTKDKTRTLTYAIPNESNAVTIAKTAQARGISAIIAVSYEENPRFIVSRGGRIMPLISKMHSAVIPKEDFEQSHFAMVSEGGTSTKIENLNQLQTRKKSFSEFSPSASAIAFTKFKGQRRPSQGPGLALSIDLREFPNQNGKINPDLATFFNEVIVPIKDSPQYTIVEQDGYLCVVATAESLMKSLGQTQKDFFAKTGRKSNSFITEINIEHEGAEQFTVEGLPNENLRKKEKPKKASYSYGTNLNTRLRDHATRETRGCQVTLKEIDAELSEIENFQAIIDSLKEGGPREHMGAKQDIRAAIKALRDPNIRKLIINGPAGVGKSSLVEFLIKAGYIKNPLRLYIDPGESDIPGAALASITTYIVEDARKRLTKKEIKFASLSPAGKNIFTAFAKIADMSTIQKRKIAQEQPQALVKLTTQYITLLSQNYGNVTPIFDNSEAKDAFSAPFIHQIMEGLAEIPAGRCTMIETERNEARYTDLKGKASNGNIEKTHGKNSVIAMTAKGADFNEKQLTTHFVIGCLEESLNLDLAEDTQQYHQDLEKYTVDPQIIEKLMEIDGLNALQMTSIMQVLAPELELGAGNVISVKSGSNSFNALANVHSARDLAGFHANMLNHLNKKIPNAKALLEILAITKGKITLAQAAEAIGMQYSEIQMAVEVLIKDNYIVAANKADIEKKDSSELGDLQFSIRHSSFAATIESGMSSKDRGTRSEQLDE